MRNHKIVKNGEEELEENWRDEVKIANAYVELNDKIVEFQLDF